MPEAQPGELAIASARDLLPVEVNTGLALALLNQHTHEDKAGTTCPDAPRSVSLREANSAADLHLSSRHGDGGVECVISYGSEMWWLRPVEASVIHGYPSACPGQGKAADGMTYRRIDHAPLTGLGKILTRFSGESVRVVAADRRPEGLRGRVAAGLSLLLAINPGH